jgi:hypothetical protein
MPVISPAPGRICKVWETDFENGTTLPDWLALDTTGTNAGSSLVASTEPPGGVQLVTASSSGTQTTASLVADPVTMGGLGSGQVRAIRMRMVWTQGSVDANKRGLFGFLGTGVGAWASWDNSEGTDIAGRSGTGDTASSLNFHAYEYPGRFVVSILWHADNGRLYLGYGDRTATFYEFGATVAVPGLVTPTVRVGSTSGVKTLSLHQLRIERWWQ